MKALNIITAVSLMTSAMTVGATESGAGAHCKHGGMSFTQADTNQDGSLDKSEAEVMHQKQFDQKDTNHDGKLSADEMKACSHKDKK